MMTFEPVKGRPFQETAMVDFARWLHVEYLNGVAHIAFPRTDMGEESALDIGSQLSQLAEKSGCRRFVLNLGMVRCPSSTMLGKLIAFHKQVKRRGGELTLCSLTPEVAARFETMRLNKLFHICSTEEQAVGTIPTSLA
jgi:stage II sporulation protein AA (anti-sigma F factor antagonist)